jgi:hypothetical protein
LYWNNIQAFIEHQTIGLEIEVSQNDQSVLKKNNYIIIEKAINNINEFN